jgi:hypothetical protein
VTNGFADRELIGDDDTRMRLICLELDVMKVEVVGCIEGKQSTTMFRREL